jgi:hypothetical protein
LRWLPGEFEAQLLKLTNALIENKQGYLARAKSLKYCYEEVVAVCQQDGIYGKNAVDEAFIRLHDEPGRDWNMGDWNKKTCKSLKPAWLRLKRTRR